MKRLEGHIASKWQSQEQHLPSVVPKTRRGQYNRYYGELFILTANSSGKGESEAGDTLGNKNILAS